MPEKKSRMRITKMLIVSLISLTFLIPFAPIGPNINPLQPAVALSITDPTATKYYNLTFIQDHNFSDGAGGWPDSGGFYYDAGNDWYWGGGGECYAFNSGFWMNDTIVRIDYKAIASTNTTNTEILFRCQTTSLYNIYKVGLPLAFDNITTSASNLDKYVSGSWQGYWATPNQGWTNGHPSTGFGNQDFLQFFNDTWTQMEITMVQRDISITWHNLNGNNTNGYRHQLADNTSSPFWGGYLGFRTWGAVYIYVRNITFDYGGFPISLRAGQSASVGFGTKFTGPSFTAPDGLAYGSLSNGHWTYTSSIADVGVHNLTFRMTSGTTTINKTVILSVFPDFTTNNYWEPTNPVVANTPTGNMSVQLFDPNIIKDGDVYRMWFSVAQPAPYSEIRTYYLISTDRIHWYTEGWTNPLTNPPAGYCKLSIVKIGSTYNMAIGNANVSGIWWYTSTNGIDWGIQNNGTPIVVPSLPWELNAIQGASMTYEDGTWRVCYGVGALLGLGTSEPSAGGFVYGSSLTSLTKYPHPFNLIQTDGRGNFSLGFGGFKPIRYANGWLAIVNGFDYNHQSRATLAMSSDYINWFVYPDFVVFPLNVQSWETGHSYTGDLQVESNGDIGFWINGWSAPGHEEIGFILYDDPIIPTYSPGIDRLLQVIFIVLVIGIVVGVASEGIYSLRKEKERTSQEMMRSLFNMVLYIVIGLSILGTIYIIIS